MEELKNGIAVFDEEGEELGISITAGRKAVGATILTRIVFIPMAPLLVPPAVMTAFGKTNWFQVAPKKVQVFVHVGVIAACLGLALPCCLALQPQKMALEVGDLEEQFRGRVTKSGKPVEKVFANKGL